MEDRRDVEKRRKGPKHIFLTEEHIRGGYRLLRDMSDLDDYHFIIEYGRAVPEDFQG